MHNMTSICKVIKLYQKSTMWEFNVVIENMKLIYINIILFWITNFKKNFSYFIIISNDPDFNIFYAVF